MAGKVQSSVITKKTMQRVLTKIIKTSIPVGRCLFPFSLLQYVRDVVAVAVAVAVAWSDKRKIQKTQHVCEAKWEVMWMMRWPRLSCFVLLRYYSCCCSVGRSVGRSVVTFFCFRPSFLQKVGRGRSSQQNGSQCLRTTSDTDDVCFLFNLIGHIKTPTVVPYFNQKQCFPLNEGYNGGPIAVVTDGRTKTAVLRGEIGKFWWIGRLLSNRCAIFTVYRRW